jgi:hypothetical protein
MLIPLQEILNKYKLNPKGVIHVGAHFAEEHEDYIKCGIERFVYIEPCKQAFGIMNDRINEEGALLFNVACGAEENMRPCTFRIKIRGNQIVSLNLIFTCNNTLK